MHLKLLLPAFFLFLSSFEIFAQRDPCIKTPYNCNANLVQPQFGETEIVVIRDISYAKAKYGSSYRPFDVGYKDQCNQEDVCWNDGRDLRYDVFYPGTHNYSLCALPVIFLFHPGNFSDCSSKDEHEGASNYAKFFAQRGFVAINVEYRRGTNEDPSKRVSASKAIALYRASQDGRGAIRSVIALQQNTTTPYKINFDYIFVGDAGTNPLNIAYVSSQATMNEIIPDIEKVLGPLNADYYYGDSSIKYSIKGVFNESGGLLVKPSMRMTDLFIDQGTKNIPALISFHGILDNLIRIDYKKEFYSVNPQYKTEAFCLSGMTYTVPKSNSDFPDLLFLGSGALHETLQRYSIPSELYIDFPNEACYKNILWIRHRNNKCYQTSAIHSSKGCHFFSGGYQ